MKHAELLPHAQAILDALAPSCEDISLAGGLRRGKAESHDAEIVCLPKRDPNLFGVRDEGHLGFDLAMGQLMRDRKIEYDMHIRRNGPLYKRFVICAINVPLDLFIADTDNYGNILAIRTGDSDFSRLLVTKRTHGGLMPNDHRQLDGRLHWLKGGCALAERVRCRTEADFFAALGIRNVPDPCDRNEATARRLARGVAS